jgi:hypothetical protein
MVGRLRMDGGSRVVDDSVESEINNDSDLLYSHGQQHVALYTCSSILALMPLK